VAEQLNILGLWERTDPEVAKTLPPEPVVPLPERFVDPRQEELLVGAHTLRATLEDACVALDAAAVHAAHTELISAFTGQPWAESVPRWVETLSWLVGAPTADEQAQRALALAKEEHLPGMSATLFELVRGSALKKSASRLLEEGGVTATFGEARPAGFLLLVGGELATAKTQLSAASEAVGDSNAAWLGYLGEASWRLGDSFGALQSYCRASLLDSSRIDQEHLTCQPVLDLLDLGDELEVESPLSHLAVLADLAGRHPVDEVQASSASSAPVRLAAQLRAYRRDRASGVLDEAGRLAAKRELARLAPAGLRELIRRL
jgi:hypothetical protein